MTVVTLGRVCPQQGTRTALRDSPAEKEEQGREGTRPWGYLGPWPDLCSPAVGPVSPLVSPAPQNMDKATVPSVTLIVGCGVSSLTLLMLVIIYVSVWRWVPAPEPGDPALPFPLAPSTLDHAARFVPSGLRCRSRVPIAVSLGSQRKDGGGGHVEHTGPHPCCHLTTLLDRHQF